MPNDAGTVRGELIEAREPDRVDERMRRRIEEDDLGAAIIEECRLQLMLRFRFLDLALWKMDLAPIRGGAAYPLATNGSLAIYDPPRLIARFGESSTEAIRDYLHMVMHCIFRHPFDTAHESREAWDLAADIIAEGVALDLAGARFPSADDVARRSALDEIRMLIGDVLPTKAYRLVKAILETPAGQSYRGLTERKLHEWRVLFERDEHAAWPRNADGQQGADDQATAAGGTDEEQEGGREHPIEDASADQLDAADQLDRAQLPESMQQMLEDEGADPTSAQDDASAAEGGEEEAVPDAGPAGQTASDPMTSFQDARPPDDEAEREWEDISKRIEMDASTFSKEWGAESASLMANLAVANTMRFDYDSFLRAFMTRSEELLINPDEFDYVYYAYGMELYGNMPLVEPLEYKETKRIRDFVIALDTSESVRGELVQAFVRHTFRILKSSEEFASDVRVHVIQCDSRVQHDLLITDLRDVDWLLEGYRMRGFGGTDFRPAFDHVAQLQAQGRLSDLQGMIYFTDGLGTFPEKAPGFDAAFVFIEEEGRAVPPVPPWAMRVVIAEDALGGMSERECQEGKR